jgi:hypothetical protein
LQTLSQYDCVEQLNSVHGAPSALIGLQRLPGSQ